MAIPAIFLDRDGVINANRPDYVKSWEEFSFLPGALEAISALASLNLPIVVVTNQAGVGRHLTTLEQIHLIHDRMIQHIQGAGGRIDAIGYCPHGPDDRCQCRKPEPGMLLDAATNLDLDLSRSVFVGDAFTDILAGQRVSCRTVLVLTGRGQDSLQLLHTNSIAMPDVIAPDLLGAVQSITSLISDAHVQVSAQAAAAAAHDAFAPALED